MIWKIFHPFYRIRIQYIKNDYIDISVIDINFYRTSHFSKLINQSNIVFIGYSNRIWIFHNRSFTVQFLNNVLFNVILFSRQQFELNSFQYISRNFRAIPYLSNSLVKIYTKSVESGIVIYPFHNCATTAFIRHFQTIITNWLPGFRASPPSLPLSPLFETVQIEIFNFHVPSNPNFF